MSSKLERLALSVRRTGSNSEEWADPNEVLYKAASYAKEDRRTGGFPYDDTNLQGIKDFYRGKDILITGGTGFVGKVLIEKILRSLPEAGRIFLLLRGRKGLSAQQRVRAMLELPLFKLVMTENPEAANRLVVIEGDCGSLGLGLAKDDRQTLINNVSTVFHCAATVRFDLTTAHLILVNTRGTREMVYLCREMKKLDALIHVSTAFSNATKDRTTPIPEEVLPQRLDWKMAIATAERSDEGAVLDLLFKKLDTRHQNNYTLSKGLAECVVEEEGKGLPIVIVRPTVVIATYEDPFGGWVDNLYGPMSVWDGINRGVVRTHYSPEHINLDYLPVDLCVKVLIATAWHRGLGFRTSSDPTKIDVVNNGTGDFSVHSFGLLHEKMQILFDRHTHRYNLRYPRFHATNRFWLFWLITVFSHIPLGILVDTGLRLTGRKPMLLSIYRRLYFAQTRLVHFFCTHEFHFDFYWQWILQNRMPESDRGRFSIVTTNCFMAYYHDNIAGIIKYVFNEKTYSAEQSNRNILYYFDWIQNVLLVVFAWLSFRLLF